jgi:hypothetical protein
MSHMSLKTLVAGCGERSIGEGGSPGGQIWRCKGCGFDVVGESSRMRCGEITCPGSIQSAGGDHVQVGVEVIVGRGPWKSKWGGGWQEEASSRGFTKAQAHTDSSYLIVTVGWVLRDKWDLVRYVRDTRR